MNDPLVRHARFCHVGANRQFCKLGGNGTKERNHLGLLDYVCDYINDNHRQVYGAFSPFIEGFLAGASRRISNFAGGWSLLASLCKRQGTNYERLLIPSHNKKANDQPHNAHIKIKLQIIIF